MTIKLTKELADALSNSGNGEVELIDPETNRVFVVVDEATHRRAMTALHALQGRAAIAEGVAQLEAGEGKPAEEVFENMRIRLGFPSET